MSLNLNKSFFFKEEKFLFGTVIWLKSSPIRHCLMIQGALNEAILPKSSILTQYFGPCRLTIVLI